ncbi:MAG TPA: hypothetical protein VGP95_14095 [Gemmatimonadaceae bacterium]|nr:hypothetical protein [Gemmatimonadaceae bacterium]
MPQPKRGGKAGMGVDAHGGPVIDPTENVIALNEAANKRQDDLRQGAKELSDAKIAHQKEIGDLRATHAKETRTFDNDRWDKIRSVDMANAAATATQILQAVNTNAAAQERTAQTLRDQVATTATAAENRQAAFAADMVKRLSAVELSMSKGEGKQQIADPASERTAMLVERLITQQAAGTGKTDGADQTWKWIALVAGLALAFLSYQNRAAPAAPTAPQVIYVPAPSQTVQPSTAPAMPR